MNESKRNIAPFDEGSYQIGTVTEPRSRGGIVMLLLMAVVVLGGIVTILGTMNVHLFAALQAQDSNALHLHSAGTAELQTATVNPMPKFSMELKGQPAPEEPTEALTPQQIYANCIDAMVSVRGETAEGMGVVLAQNGYIITAHHVVQDARSITVDLTDGRCLPATVIGTDPASDLAVLYVEANDLSAPIFADPNNLEVGDTVCAFGDPLGFRVDGTMTNSTVSSVSKDTIATDLQNHAGPLLDRFGQVIGVQFGESGATISIATVKDIAEQLINQGYVSGRPGLGIQWESVPELHQNYYELPAGLYITQADEANGLSVGDILISLNGRKVTSEKELLSALNRCQVGDVVELELYRDGQRSSITITVAEAKE